MNTRRMKLLGYAAALALVGGTGLASAQTIGSSPGGATAAEMGLHQGSTPDTGSNMGSPVRKHTGSGMSGGSGVGGDMNTGTGSRYHAQRHRESTDSEHAEIERLNEQSLRAAQTSNRPAGMSGGMSSPGAMGTGPMGGPMGGLGSSPGATGSTMGGNAGMGGGAGYGR